MLVHIRPLPPASVVAPIDAGDGIHHLKILGRIAFFMISSGYQPPPPKVGFEPQRCEKLL